MQIFFYAPCAQVLKDLRSETAAMNGSHMQITPDQGALLGVLVTATGAQRIVEVGVFTGYSSLAMAMVGEFDTWLESIS